MRIIKDHKKTRLPKDQTQRFFIQSWYSLIHKHSSDSHRVRCMNSLNIIEELQSFLSGPKSLLPKIKADIKRTVNEAIEILDNDTVISKYFHPQYSDIKDLLSRRIINEDSENKKDIIPDILIFLIRDFFHGLKSNYKKYILAEIRNELYGTKNLQNLYALIGSLLSVLIHEGHSIEELYVIIVSVFIQNKSTSPKTFDENFNFVEHILKRDISSYKIIFKLLGCSRFTDIEPALGNIIVPKIELNTSDKRVKEFLETGQNILFATFTVNSQDDRSAGLIAKRNLDLILDLIRFELEDSVIKVERDFISIRNCNKPPRRFPLPTTVPNPSNDLQSDQFLSFISKANNLFSNNTIDIESKEKIRSALRFYRMGRDSDLFENKFLNWWTALEFLSRTQTQGSIIDDVESNLKPILLVHYLEKHVLSYKNSLFICTDIMNKEEPLLNVFDSIHNDLFFNQIIDSINEVPLLKYRLENFKEQTKDIQSQFKFLDKHEKHLHWHLHRIWRTRCDIVHSAEYSINLNLLCANLEYYLKFLISQIIDVFYTNQNISSINELYLRYNYRLNCIRKNMGLNKKNIRIFPQMALMNEKNI